MFPVTPHNQKMTKTDQSERVYKNFQNGPIQVYDIYNVN